MRTRDLELINDKVIITQNSQQAFQMAFRFSQHKFKHRRIIKNILPILHGCDHTIKIELNLLLHYL